MSGLTELCYCLTAEIGGYMGLLLGASLLSVCELIDVLIYHCFLPAKLSTTHDRDNEDDREDEHTIGDIDVAV